MAAEINAQLEVGVPSVLWFQPVSLPDLRQRWLDYHEHVLRSSVATVRRYRQATEHLLGFLRDVRPLRRVSDFRPCHAEEFVRYLRTVQVPLGGPAERRRRPLRDTGLKYILETCSILFNYARKNRHLSPYAENLFQTIEIGRIPVEDARPITVFTPEQEDRFLKACDDWQLPLFLTLLLTGLRSGELTHLLLPDDLDLDGGWLHIRNKPKLGWQVKTRNERDIPLVPVLVDVLRAAVDDVPQARPPDRRDPGRRRADRAGRRGIRDFSGAGQPDAGRVLPRLAGVPWGGEPRRRGSCRRVVIPPSASISVSFSARNEAGAGRQDLTGCPCRLMPFAEAGRLSLGVNTGRPCRLRPTQSAADWTLVSRWQLRYTGSPAGWSITSRLWSRPFPLHPVRG